MFKFLHNRKNNRKRQKANDKRKQFRLRVHLIFSVFALLAALLILRLYFVQFVHGKDYAQRAEDQYVNTTANFYNRGSIFFTDKDGNEISAATVKTGYTLAINPRHISDPTTLYEALSKVLELDKESFIRHASKKDDPYEEIKHQIDKETARKIRDLKEKGIILVSNGWRYYPGKSLAANSIGFVAYDGDDKVGIYGLEKYYEDVLRRADSNLSVNFFAELFANLRDIIFIPAEKREGDIITTIDPSVQLHLEQVLSEVADHWSSEMTAGIIIEPDTGKIRAIASSPTFDLNNFAKENSKLYPNILVERVYEMGSIIKPLTVAAGIDAGVINGSTTYDDKGHVSVGRNVIYNYDKRRRGIQSVEDALSHSLNVGMVFIERQLGNQRFRRYMHRFGLNEETGVDIPHESMNLVNNLNSKRDIEYATASFGQGIALTPMSTVRALSAVATGKLVQPHLVEKIRSTNGVVHRKDYSDMEVQVLKAETVEELSRILVKTMDEVLLNGTVKLENYSVAAKTGTAQIVKSGGGYDDEDVLHTFVGYFPAYEPRYLVFLMSMKPQGAPYASQTLTRPFMDITKYLINYYDIPPDR